MCMLVFGGLSSLRRVPGHWLGTGCGRHAIGSGSWSTGGSLRDRLRFAGLDAEQCEMVRRYRPALQHLTSGLRDLFQRFQPFLDAAHFESERQG